MLINKMFAIFSENVIKYVDLHLLDSESTTCAKTTFMKNHEFGKNQNSDFAR